MSIGSDIKTKEYLDEAKKYDLKLLKPDINESSASYNIKNHQILLPLLIVKNVGQNIVFQILKEREENGLFKDYLDFVVRCYKLGVNKLVIENLINAGALDSFNLNRKTMLENMANAINYASLTIDSIEGIDMKPEITRYDEASDDILRTLEYNSLGFYLTNHPASKFTTGVVKSKEIPKYFDKIINIVGLVEKINKIKTKKNEDMAFITLSDEYGNIDLAIFPKEYYRLSDLNKGDLINALGKVTKRYANYSVSVSKITKIS